MAVRLLCADTHPDHDRGGGGDKRGLGDGRAELRARSFAQSRGRRPHADRTPLDDDLSIPAEVQRRQERQAQLAQARAEIEARAALNGESAR